MSRADVSLPHQTSVARFGATSRTDAWYLQPLLVFLGLFAFIVYTTWAAFQRRLGRLLRLHLAGR